MSDDPVRQENTSAWLNQASKDLARAQRCLDEEPADTEDAVFHCQQACEKALKA
jgi:HEPN domain-containing protein